VADILTIHDEDLEAAKARAGEVLDSGLLVVAPTDTVYGVFANAFLPEATQRVFDARGAGRDAPLTVLVHNPRQLPALAKEVPETAERLMASYWPGPLTLLFQATGTLAWDLGDTFGTVAVRMPAEPVALKMISAVGPLACTSAAAAGAPPPATAEQARSELGDYVELYLDGGPRTGPPSTIVDVSGGGAEVLRVGAISADHVFQVARGQVGWGEVPGRLAEEQVRSHNADAGPDPEPGP
jgi:L-threonylcarbamoyladenylate synthase